MTRKSFAWLALFFIVFALSFFIVVKADIFNIEINPYLSISSFAPYKIKANIDGSPTSVTVELNAINGDNPSPNCWDYLIDGSCDSESVTKSMTYNSSSGKWESQNIYPDDVYPEIYFVGSEVTWYNTPSNLAMNRNSYQIFNFSNPFTMTDGMSFFIELNAVPRASNSVDLRVYLVKKNTPMSFFSSNWLSSPNVSLVGTIKRSDAFGHTHTANSAHHVVALAAGPDGKVNGLDISENFSIVLYNTTTNNARGWDLRYHPTCDNKGRWYQGSQSGWTTTARTGCPDAHIHIARRLTEVNTTIQDGVQAQITANYASGGPVVETQDFFFMPLPNLAPNSSSFITPSSGGVYDENISISWTPATDPNNNPLLYSVYLLNSNNEIISTLVSATSSTGFVLDIAALSNGTYSLKGVVTEDISPNPLSTDFFLSGTFVIDKAEPLYTLSNISLSSNNASSTLAKLGDLVTLDFSSSGTTTPTLNFYSGGNLVNGSVNLSEISPNNFRATYTVHVDDTSGPVSFDISASNLAQIYQDTSDDSSLLVDLGLPATVVSSLASGVYNSNQVSSLSSTGADYIRYTTNESTPSCASGLLYSTTLNITAPTIVKAIACDYAGNYSAVSTFNFDFQFTVTYNANGGSGHSPTSQIVNYNATTTLATSPTRPGYTFSSWNTVANGSGNSFSAATVVSSDVTVYAQWTINTYTLSYDGNGSTSGSAPSVATHNYNTNVTVATSSGLIKTDYAFNGWNTASDGSGVSYATSDTIILTSDKTLYAQWLELAKCNVTFNGNGGSGHTPGTKTFVCDPASATTLATTPTRPGYHFVAWNTQADGGGSTFDETSLVGSNITVYAQWTANTYSLIFSASGGTVTPTSSAVIYNAVVADLPLASRDNYTFSVWNTQADGSGTNYSTSTVYTVIGNTTLYAQWIGNNYSISFDSQGGTTVTSTSVTYNTPVGSLATPTKSGYTFSSWNTAANGSGTEYTSETVYQVSGNLTLYAQWQANTYQIAFNSRNGSLVSNKTVTFNQVIGALETPTRSNYDFVAWFTEPNGEGDRYSSSTVYSMATNIFLVAHWTAVLEDDDSEDESEDTVVNYGATVALPAGIGSGARDATVVSGLTIGSEVAVGEITASGVNVLTYVTNLNHFLAPQSSNNWQTQPHSFVINNLDLFYKQAEIIFYSEPKIITLNLGDSQKVDLDGDGVFDIIATFTNLYLNRAEITVKALIPHESIVAEELTQLDYEAVIANEKVLTQVVDTKLSNRLRGRLLLQVEDKGQAWYLEPISQSRYYLGRPDHAFKMMRDFGLGISESNYHQFQNQSVPMRLAGRILIRAEKNGEAYYVNPLDLKLHYLGRPADAFSIMRSLALGINNDNIRKIKVAN